MSLLLCIETSSSICSVALFKNEQLVVEENVEKENSHAALLTVLIKNIVDKANIDISSIDAFAVSMGPGSYTGLRIGVSTAKGLCYSLQKPLIAIPTLQALAAGYSLENKVSESSCLLPMIDARRMELYLAGFDANLKETIPTQAFVINEENPSQFAKKNIIYFGSAADKCKKILDSFPNFKFAGNFTPKARFMGQLALSRFQSEQFEDVAYFEPYYLKEFYSPNKN